MVIDSSALVAIILGEGERRRFIEIIVASKTRLVSAPTMLEASIVALSRRGEVAEADLREFCLQSQIIVANFTSDHATIAVDAFRRFGKGRHPAALNFGDCCTYALAKATGEPLLFKGSDFSQTDITAAI